MFDLVARATAAVGRDAVAEAFGISRRVAALHLDRLADQGLLAVEEDAGYEPRWQNDDSGAVVLGNCPFHRLAQQFTALVCGVNLQLLRGVVDGAGDAGHLPELHPGPGRCCVRLRPGGAVTRDDTEGGRG